MRYLTIFTLLLAFCNALSQTTAVNTESRDIHYQERQTFFINDVFFTNSFKGARLNQIEEVNDTLIRITIKPENSPINASPWYAFKMWSMEPKDFTIHMKYIDGPQRYFPKMSKDGKTWQPLDSTKFSYDTEEIPRRFLAQTQDSLEVYSQAYLNVKSGPDTTWIAGQEVITSKDNERWVSEISKYPYVSSEVVGESGLHSPLWKLDIGNTNSKKKMVVFSRQHPPEVTGYLAMRAFVEVLCEDSDKGEYFREEFHTIVIPMVNPDGVDQGHWRHNTGGVDLNRDWANLNQPETQQISAYLKDYIDESGSKVYFGIDFHSTWKDIFYVLNRSAEVPQVTKPMLEKMKAQLPGFRVVEREVPLEGAGTSVRFFYHELGCDGVTYEVGDDTDRQYLKEKAQAAAYSVMQVLVKLD